jgi:uncharacterized RDD family membrane protein YckC
MNTQIQDNLTQNQTEYGGTWLRLLAAAIDFFIAGLAQVVFACAAVFFLLGSASYLLQHIMVATLLVVSATLVYYFAFALYYAACESSPVQATPGKALLGLKVETKDGKKYGFWAAVGRLTLQWIMSVMFAMIVTITLFLPVAGLEAATIKMPMLEHVCWGIALFIVFIFIFVPVENNKLQSTCDKILGRRVIKSRS